MRPLLFVTRQLQRLGRGQVKPETIEYYQDDEIRQMLDSTELLINNMETLANKADTIGQGDFSSDVILLSSEDRLGIAINNMTTMLRKSREETEQQDWLKDGISKLTTQLTGDLSPQLLSERALSIIGKQLGAGRGVFYVYLQAHERLELLGSYMFTRRSHLSNGFKLGEGAIGQAARERKPILLTVQEGDETATITTGTTCQKPFYTCTWPLLREDELLGVLEFGSFTRYDALQLSFLDNAVSVVTSFIFMALQRERITNLLKQAEDNTKNAELQKMQLQENNALMEEQQQQLQQQTEELQQTNDQLEAQQQQVELQAKELRTNYEALRKSQEEVNARAAQLEEANRYKSDFLANMSHELRTPLNSINVISKMMLKNEKGKLDPESIKRAKVIYDSGNDLLRLISDILDLSKIEAGRIELYLERIPTSELAHEMQALFEETSREKKLRYKVEDRYQSTITSDRQKIVQILRNLLSNAFKFTKEGGVELSFQASGQVKRPLQITVTDTGIGIPGSELGKIFEAFRQVDGSISRHYGGTGLGLSIAKRFADLLNAEIKVESQEGSGSQFVLLLPQQLVSPHVVDETILATQQGQGEIPKIWQEANQVALSPGEKKTILVIDDDPHFQENMTLIKTEQEVEILAALSGREGLRLAKAHHPAGIILDLGLPDMPGEALLESLKREPDLQAIPVYIISAQDKDAALLRQGAIGFLQKPVTDDQIQQVESTLLRVVASFDDHLLLIEGETLKRDLIEASIPKKFDQMVVVHSAAEALLHLENKPVNLVLTDYHVIDMDCALLCEKIIERKPNMPIIIYANSALDDERMSQLRQFTDSVIQQAPQAGQRLSRNIERFLAEALPGEAQDRSVAPAPHQSRLATMRILVVDDDTRNLYVLTALLEENGAKVVKALNGRKALSLLKRAPVDLVFMDIMMPEMDGYEAIKAIRADEQLKTLPVIALTAKALKEDRQKCLAAGADDYLSKPVDGDVLVNMAQAWVEKSR